MLIFSCIDYEIMEIEPSLSSGRFKLHDQLELLEFKDQYVIKSVESPDQGFSIDRRDGNIEPLNGNGSFKFFFLNSIFIIFSLISNDSFELKIGLQLVNGLIVSCLQMKLVLVVHHRPLQYMEWREQLDYWLVFLALHKIKYLLKAYILKLKYYNLGHYV